MENGFLLLNKPKNLTSSDVVLKVKRLLGFSKIGHTGTLDKLAEGLLILPFGRYTCFSDLFLKQDKVYKFSVKYGILTDSGDLGGNIVKKIEQSEVESVVLKRKDEIEKLFMSITNWNMQVAPQISALKVKGKRQAALFRKGIEFELKKRKIQIHSIQLQSSSLDGLPGLVSVSSGTYIRKIILDLSEKLAIPIVLTSLIRQKIGKISLNLANSIEQIASNHYKIFSFRGFNSHTINRNRSKI